MSTCPFRARPRARNQVGFRKSGSCPLPGRPRPRGYFPKAPKAQWALRGGSAGPLGCFCNETACRFHSIEAKCAFPRWCGYVWAIRAGQTGPGGDGGPWGSHLSYPSRLGDWCPPGGCFFNKTACRFHLRVNISKGPHESSHECFLFKVAVSSRDVFGDNPWPFQSAGGA